MRKLLWILIVSVGLNGCALGYIDAPGADPEDYWWKDGYTAEMTKTILDKECGYIGKLGGDGSDWEKRFLQMRERSDTCMLKNGFVFMMKDAHFGKLTYGECDPGTLAENTPACKSYRERINNTPWWEKLFDWYY